MLDSLHTMFVSPVATSAIGYLFLVNAFCPTNGTAVRRKGLFLRVVSGIAALAVILAVTTLVVDDTNASTSLEQPICLLVTWLYAHLILRQKPNVAAYCTVCSCLGAECLGMVLHRIVRLIQVDSFWIQWALRMALTVLLIGCIALLAKKLLRKRMLHDGKYLMNKRKLVFSLLVLLLFLLVSNYQFIFWLLGNKGETSQNMVLAFRVIVGVSCMLLLFLQNDMERVQEAQKELELLNQMWHRQQEQYKLSKENIDIINRKCHDLKHQMAVLRAIRDKSEIDRQVSEMENAVMIYDSVIHTGNTTLDVVLTEKGLLCEANQINITCMVDGKLLNFVDTVDLYTMFGNALDNAIESVMQQQDRQKRVIQVASYVEQGMVLIRFRNYCDQPPELVDGLPRTSKEDENYHGFGLKSIRYAAEKNGGGMNIQTGSNFFTLQILLPLPQEKQTSAVPKV